MRYLRDENLDGENLPSETRFAMLQDIQNRFGPLYYRSHEASVPVPFGVKVFPKNQYNRNPQKMNMPLYVLAPKVSLTNIWPDSIRDVDFVRYGTTSSAGPVLAVHLKDGTGLLVCLTPEGKNLKESDSFGV